MKKKKKIIIAAVVLIILVCAAVVVGRKLAQKYPEKSQYSMNQTTGYSEDGLYYVKNKLLSFCDNRTGSKVVVCNKPNCEHNSSECNAYIDGIATDVMCYGDSVYIGILSDTADEDNKTDEPGVQLVQIERSGDKRRTIYSSDTGAVLSIKAEDDRLYFTSYIFPVAKENSEYLEYYDNYLYAYDLRWHKLKLIEQFDGNDDFYAGIVTIQRTSQKDSVCMCAEYYKRSEMSGDPEKDLNIQKHSVYCYNIAAGEMKYVRDMDENFYKYGQFGELELAVYKDALTDKYRIEKCDDQMTGLETFCEGTGTVNMYDGYIYLINTDYKKALYDYTDGEYYIANTAFAESGKYISDVYGIDRDNDTIYVDMHDYTGMKPGDVYFEDLSDKASQSLSKFIEDNFTAYSELEADQRESVKEWLDIGK